MTEALITNLARIGKLKVISRTSVMRYKKTVKSLPEIAKELNVDAVVEGSVLRVGNKIRITAQLINASTDQHMWAKSYERDPQNILALQREVARAIAREIKVKLTPLEETILTASQQVAPGAHEAYLLGRHHWNKRSKEGLLKSIDYFRAAIDEDPGFGLAYAGLAAAYVNLGDWMFMSPMEAYPTAKALAEKALELDHRLSEAQSVVAWVQFYHEWDFPTAEAAFKRAIEFNPNYATAHQWYAEFLVVMGRPDEALQRIDRAIELDPHSLIVGTIRGTALYYSGLVDQAFAQYYKTLEIDPDFLPTHAHLMIVYQYEDRYEDLVNSLEHALRHAGASNEDIQTMRSVFEISGKDGLYQWLLERLPEFYQYDFSYEFAPIYAAMGQTDKAFEWLEKSFAKRTVSLILLKIDKRLDPLRSDPRYSDLLKRIGFKE